MRRASECSRDRVTGTNVVPNGEVESVVAGTVSSNGANLGLNTSPVAFTSSNDQSL